MISINQHKSDRRRAINSHKYRRNMPPLFPVQKNFLPNPLLLESNCLIPHRWGYIFTYIQFISEAFKHGQRNAGPGSTSSNRDLIFPARCFYKLKLKSVLFEDLSGEHMRKNSPRTDRRRCSYLLERLYQLRFMMIRNDTILRNMQKVNWFITTWSGRLTCLHLIVCRMLQIPNMEISSSAISRHFRFLDESRYRRILTDDENIYSFCKRICAFGRIDRIRDRVQAPEGLFWPDETSICCFFFLYFWAPKVSK